MLAICSFCGTQGECLNFSGADGKDQYLCEGCRTPRPGPARIAPERSTPTAQLRAEVLFCYQGRCAVCQLEEWRFRGRLDLHRIIPGRDGGLYVRENVIPVCPKCHKQVEGLSAEETRRNITVQPLEL